MFYPMVKIKTLVGSLLVLLVLGSVYAWSLFNLPLSSKYELDIDAIAFTFGIMTLFIAIGSSSSGFLKLRIGMQNVVALSAVCTGAGLLLAAFAPNLITLYLSAGLLLGFGDGLGYMLVLTNCVKFFPKHKGLVSALCIGAYGLGSLLFKSIDSYVMANYSLENALLTWGAICVVVVTLGSILIYDAMQQASVVSGASSKREYDLQNAIRTLPYWLLSLMFFIDCMVGLYIIGVASNLGSALLNMSAAEAATAVSVVALANIAGRLVMGVLSDRLPRIRLITFDQCLSLVAIILLTVIPITQVTFFAAVALIAFSFGGTLTIYPSLISDFFGIRNLAKNYGLLYLGFGLGSLFGYAAAFIFGSYTVTFTMMGALLIVAIVASLLVRLPAELAESHKELVRTQKIRSEEEAVSAAKAAYQKASEVLAPEYAPKPEPQAATDEAKTENTDSAKLASSEETASASKLEAAAQSEAPKEAQAQSAPEEPAETKSAPALDAVKVEPSQDVPEVKPDKEAPESQPEATQAKDKSEAQAEATAEAKPTA